MPRVPAEPHVPPAHLPGEQECQGSIEEPQGDHASQAADQVSPAIRGELCGEHEQCAGDEVGRERQCVRQPVVLDVDEGQGDADDRQVAQRCQQGSGAEPEPERGEDTRGNKLGGQVPAAVWLPAGGAASMLPEPAEDGDHLGCS
jgi:hypothetical protein